MSTEDDAILDPLSLSVFAITWLIIDAHNSSFSGYIIVLKIAVV